MRRLPYLLFLLSIAVLAVGGCKSKGKTVETDLPLEDHGVTPADVRGDGKVDGVVLPDAGPDERMPDGGTPDGGPDAIQPDGVGPDAGPFIPQPCLSHADCGDEGLCVEVAPGSGKLVCAPFCMDECPGDWTCKSIYVDGPDPVSLCFPPTQTICMVCTTDKECLFAGALCIKGSGATGFCGRYCHPQDAPECPQGFVCAMAKNKSGSELGYQCLPPEGQCCVAGKLKSCNDSNPCTTDYCDGTLGCKHKNIDGPCQGPDDCTDYKCVNGACIGFAVTEDNTLNGIDDDCDGLTDEDWMTGIKVPVSAFSSTVHTMSGGGITVRGALSTPPAAGTSSGGDFRVTPGMVKVGEDGEP
ncbi:MAG: hypothetical protein FJ109_03925 [Deltaproteobacteria bacterium]|nr:hypothetical protein [Deltaproteobacteria bacterium]